MVCAFTLPFKTLAARRRFLVRPFSYLIWVHSGWLPISLLMLLWQPVAWTLSFLMGASLMWLNLLLFHWLHQILMGASSKKGIALKMPVVVFKYALWALLIYVMFQYRDLKIEAFVIGLLTWLVSLVFWVGFLTLSRSHKKEME